MNTKLEELDSIHLPQSWHTKHKDGFPLGSVLSFQLDRIRQLHMLICHHLERDGWTNAHKYVQIGMDYLSLHHGDRRDFSIVQIGAGRIGTVGGADVTKIREAMSNSLLPVTLFIKDAKRPVDIRAIKAQLSKPTMIWNPHSGLML